MVDVNALIRHLLLSSTAVTSLLGTNAGGSIYAGALPEHFDPALGPGIQLLAAGGSSHDEVDGLVDRRVQVRVWANVYQYELANQVFGAIHDSLHGQTNLSAGSFGKVVRALEASGPNHMDDPDTGWATVYGFFTVMAVA
jgi:hypothetical protein